MKINSLQWSTIKYILFLVFALLFVCTSCKFPEKKEKSNKPNIILIMADDLGYEALGCNGGQSYATPNLDYLAKKGMRFTQCYATPLCTPSRVQLMTGQYNFRNYIGFGLLDPKEKTFGHYLKKLGYTNYIAGKWQLLGSPHQQKLAGGKKGTTPEKAGFDDYCLWQIGQIGSRYKNPLLSTKNGETKEYKGQYGPDIFVAEIEKFMEIHKKDPMFIYYPMALTHDPFVPTPDNPDYADYDPRSKMNDPAYFGEMVHYMDKLVGRIIAKTEALGIRENTLILFVGDNGTDRKVTSVTNGTSLKGDKGHTTNAGTHVPLIANWKGRIKEGTVNDNLIDFTDFLPTLMETAAKNKKVIEQTDGLSFYPQLFGDNSRVRDWTFCYYNPNWGHFKSSRYVQNKKWKLYGNGDFFNLELDPLEENPMETKDQPAAIKSIVNEFQEVLNKYDQ